MTLTLHLLKHEGVASPRRLLSHKCSTGQITKQIGVNSVTGLISPNDIIEQSRRKLGIVFLQNSAGLSDDVFSLINAY
jgi:hypothetical protein